MEDKVITSEKIHSFSEYLIHEEKSVATQEKYLRDIRRFINYAGSRSLTKELVLAWKKNLIEQGYAIRSINSMLASINSLIAYMGWDNCKVKSIRLQRQIYSTEEKELSKEEYRKLLDASKKNERLNLLIQTICGTGIRVSELQYFTVEAVQHSEVIVNCKNKIRTIILPNKLQKLLLRFAKQKGITAGPIFVTRSGKPLNRSNIWSAMKKLCISAGVKPSKVFPHNLHRR